MLNDHNILRELAAQVNEISLLPIQEKKRELWRGHNSMEKCEVPILVSMGWWDVLKNEIITEDDLKCNDPVLRDVEFDLRHMLFLHDLADDTVIEPWINVRAVFDCVDWGVDITHVQPEQNGGSYKLTPTIIEDHDIDKLVIPCHAINESKTNEKMDKIAEAIDGIMPVNLNRGPIFTEFQADISFWLGQLLGVEEIMHYLYDRPEFLTKALEFLRDGILKVHKEAELAGDFKTFNSANQAMCYSRELPDPVANGASVSMKNLWGYFAAQEFALISPKMHEEFLLDYQLPIMDQYGLIAYGCCEDLTQKISMLRKVPNLRRIAVSPFADVGKCAAQIGLDYILSYRPAPSMLCANWDTGKIRKRITEDVEKCKDTKFDITLKDLITVDNEPSRLFEWIKIVRDIVS